MNKILLTLRERVMRAQNKANYADSTAAANQLISSISFVRLAEAGTIDEVTASEHSQLFIEWDKKGNYIKGDIRKVTSENNEVTLHKCLQPHKGQADWSPKKAVSLWVTIGDPAIEFNPWSQPVGAHDAYQMDDKSAHKSKNWRSTINDNVWEPGVYGWEEVK